jgi:hypothetical protein
VQSFGFLNCSVWGKACSAPQLPTAILHAGITKVGFPEYVAASWAGMLPGTFAYVYLGSLGKVAADAADTGAAGGFDGIKLALYGKAATAQCMHWVACKSACPAAHVLCIAAVLAWLTACLCLPCPAGKFLLKTHTFADRAASVPPLDQCWITTLMSHVLAESVLMCR